MLLLSHTRIGNHRGAPRYWLSSRRLADAGFLPGSRFVLTADPVAQALRITLADEGNRRVSAKTRRGREIPVIDLNGRSLADILGSATRVRTALSRGSIEIRLHPDDAAAESRLHRALMAAAGKRDIEIGSVCHGIGVLDHAVHEGLQSQGLRPRLAFAIDIDPDVLELSLKNNPIWDDRSIAIAAPMQELDASDLPKIDVMVAGLPCVGASRSGKAKNGISMPEEHATAGALFVSWLNIVKATNPSVILLENVPDWQNSVSQTVIRSFLSALDYQIHETVLSGPEMGALDRRKRFCMIATTRGIAFDAADIRAIRVKERCLGDILDPAIGEDHPLWRRFDGLDAKAERDRAKGNNFAQEIVGPEAEIVRSIGAHYYKVRSTEPRLRHPTRPGVARLLTVQEHARMKTVPAQLVAGAGWTEGHFGLGNSVIHSAFVAAGAAIGRSIRALAPAPAAAAA